MPPADNTHKVKHVPEWFPGSRFKRFVKETREISCTDWVKNKCVRMCTHLRILCNFLLKVGYMCMRSVDCASMRMQK